jgi:glycine dehydrogenase subunit 1
LGGVPVSRLLPEQSHVQDLIIVANTEVNSDDDRARFIDALRAAI